MNTLFLLLGSRPTYEGFLILGGIVLLVLYFRYIASAEVTNKESSAFIPNLIAIVFIIALVAFLAM